MRVLLLALCAIALPAFATNWDDDDCRGNCGGSGEAVAKADADATAKAGAVAISGDSNAEVNITVNPLSEDVLTAMSAPPEVTALGGTTGAVTLVGDTTTYKTRYQAPNVFSENPEHTTSCVMTWGFSGSASGSNGSGGTAFGIPDINENCVLDQDVETAFLIGDFEAGWNLWCRKDNILMVNGYTEKKRVFGLLGKKRTGDRETAINTCLDTKKIGEAELVALGTRITKVEATQNVYMNDGLTDRVDNLEGVAHRPESLTLLVDEPTSSILVGEEPSPTIRLTE